MYHCGIDLGYHGALVVLDSLGHMVSAAPMPVLGSQSRPRGYHPRGIAVLARALLDLAQRDDDEGELHVVLEAPAHVRIQGVLHAHATASLFLCAGLWIGAFHSLGVEPAQVAATTWQHELLTGIPGRTSKARASMRARLIDASLAEPDGVADAACIAEWSRGLPLFAAGLLGHADDMVRP